MAMTHPPSLFLFISIPQRERQIYIYIYREREREKESARRVAARDIESSQYLLFTKDILVLYDLHVYFYLWFLAIKLT